VVRLHCAVRKREEASVFESEGLSGSKPEQYIQLLEQARALMHGERDRIANAANLSALVFHSLPALNWVGFYFYDGNELVVGPFQGRPACVRIALGRGVCGTAAVERTTQRVADVDAFPGHIPCDSASRSELVVPLYLGDRLVGVFDLDSPQLDRFDADDQHGLEAIAAAFVEQLAD
jgi:L-methionine (R)-S-oxide reductase